jgi:RNA polymerase sigma-70 factor (ECF subfamily)
VYQSHHLVVFRFIYGLNGGPIEDVEDLTTITFLRAWKSRRRFRGSQDAALGWLLRIARNLVIDTHRREKRRGMLVDIEKQPLSTDDPLPEERLSHDERIQVLQKSLAKLPEHHREMIVLRYLLGWRVKDIATHLEMSDNTVSATIRRILKRLQESWPET